MTIMNNKEIETIDRHEAGMIDLDNAMHMIQQSLYFKPDDESDTGFNVFELYGKLKTLQHAVTVAKIRTEAYMNQKTFEYNK